MANYRVVLSAHTYIHIVCKRHSATTFSTHMHTLPAVLTMQGPPSVRHLVTLGQFALSTIKVKVDIEALDELCHRVAIRVALLPDHFHLGRGKAGAEVHG